MSKVGIIVNPFSATDLRRFTTQASTVGINEKVRKVNRIISAMEKFGIRKVYLMPDVCRLNASIANVHNADKDSDLEVEVLDYSTFGLPEETIKAVNLMKEKDIKCIIILGGDGTNRLAASIDIEIPSIPVATGTNNAYCQTIEETNIGVAAAYVALNDIPQRYRKRCKRIEVYMDGKFTDIALIDAAVTSIPYTGCKVVTDVEDISDLVVCRCGPDLIGISSIIGCVNICEDDDDFGFHTEIDDNGIATLASVNSGEVSEVVHSKPDKVLLDSPYVVRPDFSGTIALDGERTLPFKKNTEIKFVITRNGPIKLDVKEMLYEAVKSGFHSVGK